MLSTGIRLVGSCMKRMNWRRMGNLQESRCANSQGRCRPHTEQSCASLPLAVPPFYIRITFAIPLFDKNSRVPVSPKPRDTAENTVIGRRISLLSLLAELPICSGSGSSQGYQGAKQCLGKSATSLTRQVPASWLGDNGRERGSLLEGDNISHLQDGAPSG